MFNREPRWLTILLALLPVLYGLAVAVFVVRGLLRARPEEMAPAVHPDIPGRAGPQPAPPRSRVSFRDNVGWTLALAGIAVLAILYAIGVSDRLVLLLGLVTVAVLVLVTVLIETLFSRRSAGTEAANTDEAK